MKPTNDEIMAWAREAGANELASRYGRTNFIAMTKNDLEKFAALAYAAGAAAERKAIAEMVSQCDPRAKPKGIAAAIRALGDDDA